MVFDSDFKINLPKLYKASTYLKRPDVEFINGATDKVIPLQRGLTTLGRWKIYTEVKADAQTQSTKLCNYVSFKINLRLR